jgi:hypothetical protein
VRPAGRHGSGPGPWRTGPSPRELHGSSPRGQGILSTPRPVAQAS